MTIRLPNSPARFDKVLNCSPHVQTTLAALVLTNPQRFYDLLDSEQLLAAHPDQMRVAREIDCKTRRFRKIGRPLGKAYVDLRSAHTKAQRRSLLRSAKDNVFFHLGGASTKVTRELASALFLEESKFLWGHDHG